jgi:chromosome partitioning protein
VDAYQKLSQVLHGIEGYDLLLIDSPPSLSVMTLNGLVAADSYIIPLRPALYSLQGTNDLLASVAKVKKSLNPELELIGVVLNDYLAGPVISRQIKAEIIEGFGQAVFQTMVSRTIKIEEAIASRTAVVEEVTKVAQEINALVDELLLRLAV